MNWIEALILGILQGLTEYLPVSSSGHITIGSALFGITDPDTILPFTIVVHIATVLATIVILWNEVTWIFKGLFKTKGQKSAYAGSLSYLNDEQNYTLNILISMIPIGIIGLCFKDYIEDAFSSLLVVGICLIITAALLAFSSKYTPKKNKEHISMLDALIIGIAQAFACLPGLSRSGSTIATGLLLGDKKDILAQFSFLMVIPPILGEALLDIIKIAHNGWDTIFGSISPLALTIGFIAAFISGCIACKWMISIVRRGKLIWFALYCSIIGIIAITLNYVL